MGSSKTDILSMRDFSRQEAEQIIQEAIALKQKTKNLDETAHNKVLASLFFENSTRTRESHELAAKRLGMKIMGFAGTEGTSVKKGEPLADTARMYTGFGADIVVMRHNLDGAARYVADIVNVPVINAGDGANAHPTQTLLDLMTIQEKFSKIDGLKIAMVGDLKYGRTVHSLLQGLALFDNVTVWAVAPPGLEMPDHCIKEFENKTKKTIILTKDLSEVLPEVDVLYMTRIQRERFPLGQEGEYEFKKVSGMYELTAQILTRANPRLCVMHPLPRVKHKLEIHLDVDATPRALYFEQARNGVFIRQVLISHLLGVQKQRAENKEENGLWREQIINQQEKKDSYLYRLDNGTLIDHLEPGKGVLVYSLLGLDKLGATAVVSAHNIESTKYGRKDVMAIHNVRLTPRQLWKLALVSERATVNFIENKQVVQKGTVVLPRMLEGLLLCQNLNCITRPEHFEHAPSKFYVDQDKPLRVRCYYCERTFDQKAVELIR
ncbi:aspartate carbamoyltransferase [Candidatus Woesearchaeota archaeon]|nr:aspartate carbamoyltransferase [Candidatus Woesearchaeota archaeon]